MTKRAVQHRLDPGRAQTERLVNPANQLIIDTFEGLPDYSQRYAKKMGLVTLREISEATGMPITILRNLADRRAHHGNPFPQIKGRGVWITNRTRLYDKREVIAYLSKLERTPHPGWKNPSRSR